MNGIKSGTAYLTITNISNAIIAKYAQFVMNERLNAMLFLDMIYQSPWYPYDILLFNPLYTSVLKIPTPNHV